MGDLFTTVIICKKCHYNLEKISGLCNKLSFTHSPKQYKIPSSVYILKCLEGSLFFNILYIFVLLYFWEEGKEVGKIWNAYFLIEIFPTLIFISLWLSYGIDYVLPRGGRGAFVCGWVRNCFVGSSFFLCSFSFQEFSQKWFANKLVTKIRLSCGISFVNRVSKLCSANLAMVKREVFFWPLRNI